MALMFGASNPVPPEEHSIYCPVCNTLLGTKHTITVKSFHCNDCKATYWFYPNDSKKPKAVLDKELNKKKGCGCGRCNR